MFLSPDQLSEIEYHCSLATPGPWNAARLPDIVKRLSQDPNAYVRFPLFLDRVFLERPADLCAGNCDAEFIAIARRDLPLAVAEIKRLRDRLKKYGIEPDDEPDEEADTEDGDLAGSYSSF